jgi:hypothetical protein
MNLPMNAPLATAAPADAPEKSAADYPTKFEQVAPGSTILVGGVGVETPFEAIVLDMTPEWGPTAIPALTISHSKTREVFTIPASGHYTVRVLVDAKRIAASMPAPKSAVKVKTVVRVAEALRFTGGIESATEVMTWAIGHTTFRYVQGTDAEQEHLIRNGAEGGVVWPGDYLVRHVNDEGVATFEIVPEKTFAAKWEEAL